MFLLTNSNLPNYRSINNKNSDDNKSNKMIKDEISKFQQTLPQILAVSVKNILLLGYGMTLGFPTIVIPAIQGGEGREPSIHDDLILNKEQISWFSSINLICVPLGCVFSGAFTQPIGRRKAMQIVNIPIMIAWLCFYFSTNIYHLYAGLCLAGLSGGLLEAPVLTYVAEITQPRLRGILAATGSTCVILGVFTQFLLGSFMKWRTIALCSSFLPVISSIALFFVPESPHWLIRKSRIEEAKQSLAWLRGWVPTEMVDDEFQQIYDLLVVKEIDKNNNSNYFLDKVKLYTSKTFLIPYGLITLTFFIGHFSGMTTLQTYAVQIFHTLKAPIDKYYATVLLGCAELMGTISCVILVHITGKRPLVMASTIGCGLCFLGTATYAYYLDIVPGVSINNIVANVSAISLNQFASVIPLNKSTLLIDYNDIINDTDIKIYDYNENTSDFFQNNDDNTTVHFHHDIIYDMFGNSFDMNIYTNETNLNNSKFNDNIYDEYYNDDDDLNKTITSPEKESIIPKDIFVPLPKSMENKYLWVPLTLLLGSAFLSHAGIRLIPWMLIGEVYPASVRSGASGLSGGTGYVFGFLANKLFLKMISSLTLPGTFWFYSSVSLIGGIILYFILPETEGRTLMEIEQHYTGGKKLKKSYGKDKTEASPVRCKQFSNSSLQIDYINDIPCISNNYQTNNIDIGNKKIHSITNKTTHDSTVFSKQSDKNVGSQHLFQELKSIVPIENQNSKALGVKKNRYKNRSNKQDVSSHEDNQFKTKISLSEASYPKSSKSEYSIDSVESDNEKTIYVTSL